MNKMTLLALALATSNMAAHPASGAEEKSVAKSVVLAPVRVAGCFAAMTVGTPIAIVRLAKKQYKDYADDGKDMDGDAGGGRVMSIPMSLGDGIARGLYYGPRNALANFEHPFSRAQFSLEGSPDDK